MVGARWRIGSVGIVRAQCPWRRDVGCSIFLHPSGFPPLAVSGRVRLYDTVLASGPSVAFVPRFAVHEILADRLVIDAVTRYFFEQGIGRRESDGERWILESRRKG